jgi:hypothetical protein
MVGNFDPCNEVTLSEVVDAINEWSGHNPLYTLTDLIHLINSWGHPLTYPPS